MVVQQSSILETILAAYADEPMLQRLADQSPLVPPEGLVGSPLMLVGEAPGQDEVRLGRPFVGRAGAVLDKALKNADIERKWSWITNVVLYRPPANRTPYPYEIAASRARLQAEIQLVRPALVVAMGATAWRGLLPLSDAEALPYEDARGKWFGLGPGWQLSLFCTWHPAATFHSHEAEREFGEHLKIVGGRSQQSE